ncbi:MAG: aminotransferase class I/II-fold pyridoxal phosphate-dependent enzyme [Clostridiales bacterium]|nr:aminotransferase class I/II-fold pyridoxal phosphate-dependent enzyme [Clostridiales bacterium]
MENMDHTERRRHGGEQDGDSIVHDFSININPLGLPQAVRETLREGIDSWDRYPDPKCRKLTEAIAGYHKIPSGWVCCGNGAADLIWQIVRQQNPRHALVVEQACSEYRSAVESIGSWVRTFLLTAEDGFEIHPEALQREVSGMDMVFFCNPNNPTGRMAPSGCVEKLARACQESGAVLVVDECFLPFLEKEEDSAIPLLKEFPNLIVIRAFTKIYAMAGLRLGYALCSDEDMLEACRQKRQPWPISVPAEEAGVAALSQTDYLKETRSLLRRERPLLARGLCELGFVVCPGEANFILFFVPGEPHPGWLGARMRAEGILIRDCSNFIGLGPGYYRVSVRTPGENRYLLEKLERGITDEFVPPDSGG